MNELVGVKRFHQLTRAGVIELLSNMVDAGESTFKPLGDGVASSVFTDGKSAYKFWLKDSGYEKYLEYVIKNQDNPFVPKLKSVVKTMPTFHKRAADTPERMRWIKMEVLSAPSASASTTWQVDDVVITSMRNFLNYFVNIANDIPATRVPVEVEKLFRRNSFMKVADHLDPDEDLEVPAAIVKLAMTAYDIGKMIGGKIINDLEAFNVMRRSDGTPVIIDPLASTTDHSFNKYLSRADDEIKSGMRDADRVASGPSRKPSEKTK